MKRPIPTRQHPRFGLLSLRPGTWASEVQSTVRGESDELSINRLLAQLPTDPMLQQQAATAVAGWNDREAFLIDRGAIALRDREEAWITALAEALL